MIPIFPMFPIVPNLYKLQNDYPEPPTIYALLNSKVNYGKTDEEKTPIAGLAAAGRSMFFDTTYPLANVISREYFETTILNHFLMRRIGFDTVTAFKIQLNTKLCEIMPEYNKLFIALEGWNLFNDGESVTRNAQNANSNTSTSTSTGSSTAYQTTNTNGNSTNKYSDTPQNDLSNIDDGNYLTEYTKNNNSSSGSTSTATNNNDSNSNSNSGSSVTNETITRTPSDKIRIYEEFIANRNHIFSMIFKELDSLFYQLI